MHGILFRIIRIILALGVWGLVLPAEALVLVHRSCWNPSGDRIELDFSAYDPRFVRLILVNTESKISEPTRYCVMSLEPEDRQVNMSAEGCSQALMGHRDVLIYKHRTAERFPASSIGVRVECPFSRVTVEGRLADSNHEGQGEMVVTDFASSNSTTFTCI